MTTEPDIHPALALQQRRMAASGQWVKSVRLALGFTQCEFAYFLRVAINTISAWENGRTLPSPLAEQAIRYVAADHGLDLHTLRPYQRPSRRSR